MLPYQVYKLVHVLGIALVYSALGGVLVHVLNGGDKATHRARGLVAATHGIGMLLILVGGFGMLARLGLDFGSSPWVHVKLLIWLLLGGAVALPWRVPALTKPLWAVAPVLGVIAAAMAVYKPF